MPGFKEKDLKWIQDLTCLKKYDMSIQEMKEYLDQAVSGERPYISNLIQVNE